ncbi:MAG: DUF29 domain-containing protein [Limnospira sp. PMC 1291.21]|uniref:DUF29 domain-containing protein n=1 Tax=Limnospira fusiformis PMC 851.14 TaxID=2219512 RepID=A0ABU9ETF6_LIMFS|nr:MULTISPECIES: DUF29 domain-containing protein [Limnospira]MDC0840514.1 DUF29 domain-containing protein [Limnoraphis robusta]MDY7052289.1 DUF29 domain-containing protein [Limnospira fusiformis LS22]QJB28828.1 DUF29 domain-containing protein [Limnospira fusiformis SAG 85.79]UWU51514.1 protein of unknown function DUF29 [Arthrospira platensis C1]MDT9178022.1 DUF29 domain-containing protein [Limnospira sp. PMC 1238.20]
MNNDVSDLYEQDYYLWLQETYQTLEKKEINRLDFPHLMEEILSLGNEQRRKVSSYLRQLLIHLLLYQYWESERRLCGKGWQNEIDNFRFELELLLKSRTLYNYFLQEIEEIYVKARKQAIKKSELPLEIFPERCPFTAENLLDSEFLP